MSNATDHRRRWQTPRENRTALIEPSSDRASALVAENVGLRKNWHYDLQGRPLAEISLLARRELIESARRWTAAYRNVPAAPPDPRRPIFLAGHQPQMFHPGVWFKNFMLGRLAASRDATAINLIVDGDVFSNASLLVPGGSVAEPLAVPIPFDRAEPRIPFEERKIEDRATFASFGRRVAEQIAPLVADPLVERFWPLVQSRAEKSDNLGACLAQARHRLESDFLAADSPTCFSGADIPVCRVGEGRQECLPHLGANGRQECLSHQGSRETLEVPLSWTCKGEAFQWFAAHLLARLPQFRSIYNEALREYRRLHRVRSPSHPAPDLAEDGPWLEAPLWVWTASDPRRRRLFAQTSAGEVLLSDRQSWQARLPLEAEGDGGHAVERLLDIQRSGVRIRPRALTTTLWARLALGDLFIHGIGGAKYDRVTDRLVERFFGLAAPRFMVVSATLQLPFERPRATTADAKAIGRELREVTYHPERLLEKVSLQGGEAESRRHTPCAAAAHGVCGLPLDLIAAKRRWIETAQTPENARRRCRAIREINAALQPWLEDRRRRLLEREAETRRLLQAERVLASRDYAFCLYPEAALREFIGTLSLNYPMQ